MGLCYKPQSVDHLWLTCLSIPQLCVLCLVHSKGIIIICGMNRRYQSCENCCWLRDSSSSCDVYACLCLTIEGKTDQELSMGSALGLR